MILLFGGTTEGRKAVEVLEKAGKVFYYSTKTGEQQVPLHHGVAVSGAMDVAAMTTFCREHDIALLIDAAHPFAEQLHQTVAEVAQAMSAPVIRYERIFPERDSDIVWLDDYAAAVREINEPTLLATTGVQSIVHLKPLEEKGVKVFYRILPRESSIELAMQAGIAREQLCYYEEGDTLNVDASAILLKESGMSGGFAEKVAAARALGMKIYALKRPQWSMVNAEGVASGQRERSGNGQWSMVNGPHGLRRMVEQLLPEFFPLHSGLTTGTCATAAAVAAAERLFHGVQPGQVAVVLPNGETIMVAVGYGEDYAYCIKEAGDDPDVTDGLEIRATVKQANSFEIIGGEGIGRFTLPGFDFPPGEAAINKAPREMIRENVERVVSESVSVRVSVPQGESIARRTFNPRLGIEGGISIIGVSGIVEPFSEEAFILSIRKCMEVARASDSDSVVINSGAKSEGFLRMRYPDLPPQAFVQYGNYIGETLQIASELGFARVVLGVMLGKAVKLAAGHLDTHSRHHTMDKTFVQALLCEAHCRVDISGITLARELWGMLPADRLPEFARTVINHCAVHCRPLLPHGELTILLIDDEGKIYEI